MTTIQAPKRNIDTFRQDLTTALISLSSNKISKSQARYLAKKATDKIDFSNSALNHKGVNWFAKKIINNM